MSAVLERYEKLKEKVVKRKAAFLNFMNYIEAETTWLTAPASTRFHLCHEQGLLEHSCNVAETMLKIKETLAPHIPEESCVIVALLHDLGKVGMPSNPQYLLGTKHPYYYNRNLIHLSVPIRSIYLALPHVPLNEEEVQAIVCHDGQYINDNASVATREEPLTLLLQYADTWSGFVIESTNSRSQRFSS